MQPMPTYCQKDTIGLYGSASIPLNNVLNISVPAFTVAFAATTAVKIVKHTNGHFSEEL